MSYDIQPMVSIKEKHKLLKKCFKRIGFFFFEHDPYFQACTIDWDGYKYKMKNSVGISE